MNQKNQAFTYFKKALNAVYATFRHEQEENTNPTDTVATEGTSTLKGTSTAEDIPTENIHTTINTIDTVVQNDTATETPTPLKGTDTLKGTGTKDQALTYLKKALERVHIKYCQSSEYKLY